MTTQNENIWHIRAIAFAVFIVLIGNFSKVAITLSVLFLLVLSFLIEKISGKDGYYLYATRNGGCELFLMIFVFLFATIFFKTLSGFVLFLSILFCLSVLVIQDCLSCSIDWFLDKVTNNNVYGQEFIGVVRWTPLIISFMLFCAFFDWQTLKFIEESSWNSISWRELLTKFSHYNNKFAVDSGIALSITAVKDVSLRLLSEQLDTINSIRKSLKIVWWFSFVFGLIYPFVYPKIFKK